MIAKCTVEQLAEFLLDTLKKNKGFNLQIGRGGDSFTIENDDDVYLEDELCRETYWNFPEEYLYVILLDDDHFDKIDNLKGSGEEFKKLYNKFLKEEVKKINKSKELIDYTINSGYSNFMNISNSIYVEDGYEVFLNEVRDDENKKCIFIVR